MVIIGRRKNNNKGEEELRKASFALAGTTSTTCIFSLTLLASISIFIGPTQMTTTTTAFAQGVENNTAADETTTITGNTSTPTTPSSGLELSPQPVWQEQVTITGVTQINDTHMIS